MVLRQRAHAAAARRRVANVYYNLNAGDPSKWLYAPDFSRPRVLGPDLRERQRPRHVAGDAAQQGQRLLGRAGAVPDLHGRHARPRGAARVSPEAVGVLGRPLHVSQVTWSSPAHEPAARSKRASAARTSASATSNATPNPTRDLIRVAEQCASGCAANGNIPGLVYRSQDFSVAYTGSYLWKGSVSYVTGAHSLKVGYQHTLMTDDRTWMTNNQNLTYRVQQRRAESADRSRFRRG